MCLDNQQRGFMFKIATFLAATAIAVSAHFEVLYTPEVEVTSKEVTITNFFSHPYDGTPLMNSGYDKDGKTYGLQEVFVVHKGKKRDLTNQIKKVTYSTGKSTGPGYDITLSRKNGYKSAGDYAVVIVPHPYWEPEENLYIQQITKLFVNKGGFDTDWRNRCAEGHTEMIPLVNPYNVTAGSIFRAVVVDNDGKPVEGAVVEVEYLNNDVDIKNHKITGANKITNDKKGTATYITDVNGIFSFIPPQEGFWGFAALSAGSDKTYKGAELEQDPVIWIKVTK